MAKRHLSPIVAIDVAMLSVRNGDLHVLLLQRSEAPYAGFWALPGALVDPDEDATLDHTARRMLREKVGIDGMPLEQIGAFSGKDRDTRDWSVSVAFAAPLSPQHAEVIDTGAPSSVRKWFSVRKLPSRMAFDHHAMIQQALQQLIVKLEMGGYPTAFVPKQFTLAELQAASEAILGRALDKSAFRRVVKTTLEQKVPPFSEISGEFKTGTHRPAQLYKEKK